MNKIELQIDLDNENERERIIKYMVDTEFDLMTKRNERKDFINGILCELFNSEDIIEVILSFIITTDECLDNIIKKLKELSPILKQIYPDTYFNDFLDITKTNGLLLSWGFDCHKLLSLYEGEYYKIFSHLTECMWKEIKDYEVSNGIDWVSSGKIPIVYIYFDD